MRVWDLDPHLINTNVLTGVILKDLLSIYDHLEAKSQKCQVGVGRDLIA